VKKFLAVIDNTRDRTLILLLLRTGIRIGEALSLTLNDLDIRDRKVLPCLLQTGLRGREE
jgi:integrase